MPDNSELLNFFQGVQTQTRARVQTGLEANPDDAARAVDLSESTGVPPSVVNGDLENFDKRYQGELARNLVMGNPQLRDYVNAHPLAASISNDDWGNLDRISQSASWLGQLSKALGASWQQGVGEAEIQGFKKGFGQGPIFPVTREGLAQQYPALSPSRGPFGGVASTLATGGLNLGDLLLRGSSGIFEAITSGIGAMVGTVAGEGAGREAKALAEYEVIKPEHAPMELPGATPATPEGATVKQEGTWGQPLETVEPPGAPWVKAGREPPAGLNHEIDQNKAIINSKAIDELDKTVEEVQTSTTKARDPAFLQKWFFDRNPDLKGTSIGINGDAVVALYGNKPPAPDDGLLGWLPGIADKLELARKTGADIDVPISSWIANVDPTVAKQLHDYIRMWDGGITADEARRPHDYAGADSDLGQVRAAAGLNSIPGIVKPEIRGAGLPNEKIGQIQAFQWKGQIWTGSEHSEALEAAIQDLGEGVIDEIDRDATEANFGAINSKGEWVPHSSELVGEVKAGFFPSLSSAAGLNPAPIFHPGELKATFTEVPEATPPAVMVHVTDPSTLNERGFPSTVARITGQLLDDGKTFHIDNILGGETSAYDKATEGVGTVGPANLRKILGLLKEQYPQIERITGERVSGARTGRPEDLSVDVAKPKAEGGPLKPEAVGLDARAFAKIQADLLQRQQEDLAATQKFAEKEQAKRQSQEWKDNAKTMAEEVESDFRRRPDVLADLLIGNGEVNGEKIRQRFTLRQGDLTAEQEASLPKHYVSTNGLPIDEVARLTGFQSGDEMVEALANYRAQAQGASPREALANLIKAETDNRMEAKYGQLSTNILKAAQDQAFSENDLNLLIDEYLGAALRAGVTIVDKAAIKAEALGDIGKMQLASAKSFTYEREVAKQYRLAVDALAKENPEDAIKALQRRVYNAFLAAGLKKVEKAKEQFDRLAASYAKQWDLTKKQSVEPNTSLFIRDILSKLGLRYGLTPPGLAKAISESPFSDLSDFVTKTEDANKVVGLEIPVPDWLMRGGPGNQPLNELTVAQFQEAKDAITFLDKLGREDQKILQGGKARDRANWITEARLQLANRFDPIPSDKKRGTLAQAVTTAIAASTSNETLMSRFDGRDPHGMFTETITKPGAEAANTKARLQREVAADYRKLGEIKDRDKAIASPFIDPRTGQPRTFTRSNLAVVISNMGNPYNFAVLAKGWKLDPDLLWKWVESLPNTEDLFDRAQGLGDIFKDLKSQADREYRALYDIAPESVVPRPFTMNGKSYEGWYHPIIGDPQLSKYVNKMPEAGAEVNFWPSTSNSYMKRRTGATQVIDLTYDSIPSRIDQVIHDISFRAFVSNTAKIFRDERFRDGIRTYYGKEYMEEMDQWLNRIAGDSSFNTGAMQLASKISNNLRQNVISTQIAFNLGTVEKHGLTAWLMSAREMDPNLFISIPKFAYISAQVAPSLFKRASLDLFGKSPELGDSLFDFIKKNSEEIQRRDRNFLDTMMGQQAQFEGKSTLRNRVAQAGAKAVALSDMLSAAPLWLAKYRDELEKNGGKVGDAIREADFAVRRAHGSTAVTNLPRIAANSGPITPWLTSLYGFMGTSMQRRIEIFHDLNDAFKLGMNGEIKAAFAKGPTILSSVAVYVLWTGLVEEAITGQFTDDRRGLGTKALTFLFGTVAQSIIGLRDLVYDLQNGEESAGLISTPIHDAIRLGRDLKKNRPFDKQHAGKLVEDGCVAIGDLYGLCPKHVGTVMRYGLDTFEGMQKPRTGTDIYRGLVSGTQKLRIER